MAAILTDIDTDTNTFNTFQELYINIVADRINYPDRKPHHYNPISVGLISDINTYLNIKVWQVQCAVFEIILKYNGRIFGGGARDYYTRTYWTEKYEEYCRANDIDADKHFGNTSIHPESFKGRTLLAHDLDIICNCNFSPILLNTIQDANLGIFTKSGNGLDSDYLTEDEMFTHCKYNLMFSFGFGTCDTKKTVLTEMFGEKAANIMTLPIYNTIKFDIFISNYNGSSSESTVSTAASSYLPILLKNDYPDFACNQLILSRGSHGSPLIYEVSISPNLDKIVSGGISKPPHLTLPDKVKFNDKMIAFVKQSIIEKKAIVLSSEIDYNRIIKMQSYGYIVVIHPILKLLGINILEVPEQKDDVCCLCKDEFTVNNVPISYQCPNSCSYEHIHIQPQPIFHSKYHAHCFSQYVYKSFIANCEHLYSQENTSTHTLEFNQLKCPMCRSMSERCFCKAAVIIRKVEKSLMGLQIHGDDIISCTHCRRFV